MPAYTRVVVGSDGSLGAREAVALSGRLAAALRVPVTAVTVWKTELAVPGGREVAWAKLTTASADIDLADLGVADVTRVEVEGDAAAALDDIAAEQAGSLLVVGAEGLGSAVGRFAGSASNQLSHNSSVDVLFVRRNVDVIRSVLLATDGSDTSLVAVERGLGFAAAVGADVVLVTVGDSEREGADILDRVVAAVPEAGAAERRILTGGAAAALVETSTTADLLVVGNRGMSGIGRVLGSTANTVTHRAATNLLLVNTTGRH